MADVIVLGAGVAGSLGAAALQANGHRVTVLDKGYQPGGRLATRTVDGATFDVGAQFFTVRSDRFRARVDDWLGAGVARTWFHGAPDRDPAGAETDGHPRFRGAPTMRRLATHFVGGLDLHLGTVVRAVAVTDGRIRVTATPRGADGAAPTTWTADAILLTAPVPQSRNLLAEGGAPLSATTAAALDDATYDPTIAVLAVPDGPTHLPAHGAIRDPGGDVGWITDNHASGASDRPALTIHAGGRLSRELLDHDDTDVGRSVVAAAVDLLGTTATPVHVHRWRDARPTTEIGASFLLDRSGDAPVVVAGDGFGGGRVEAAALSGLDGAQALSAALRDRPPRGLGASR